MSTEHRTLLVHPHAHSHVLSVRAKAMVFADPLSQQLLEQTRQVSQSDATVLLTGETGTGKELLAHLLHRESDRQGGFVAVNCGALSSSLAEAEFFGQEAGALPGTTQARAGWFEEASGGTLFLDEISDLPLSVQGKLLRVLQEREVVRLGSRRSIPVDFRLIAATNIDLQRAATAGKFRRDLYYRLNVVALNVPRLRERPADILPLAEYFLRLYSQRLSVPLPQLKKSTQQALLSYPWPGNIRELENVIHAAVLTARDGTIGPDDLRFHPLDAPDAAPHTLASGVSSDAWSELPALLDRLYAAREPAVHERVVDITVRRAFERTGGNQVRTARLLGVSRNVVRTLLRRAGLLGETH